VKVSRKALLDKDACIDKADEHILRPKFHIKAIIADDPSTSSSPSQPEDKLKPIGALPQFPVEPPIPFNRNFFL
jgi:hypothetical protein